MTNSTIAERVQRGASLLDIQFPGWVDSVDLSTLDLSSTCDCVLGQRFGDFAIGARQTLLAVETSSVTMGARSRAQLEEHGFLVEVRDDEMIGTALLDGLRTPSDEAFSRVDAEYVDLTNEWAKLITDRRAASQLAEVELAHAPV